MDQARLSSAIDVQLIRTLAKMALQLLNKGLDEPSSESPSHVSRRHKGTQEASYDGSRAKPTGDGYKDAGPGHRSAPGAPLTLGRADDAPPT
jgi:hypothetical protein